MKKFTRTMYEKVYSLKTYDRTSDEITVSEESFYVSEFSEEPDFSEMDKVVLNADHVSTAEVRMSLPISSFVKAVKDGGSVKVISERVGE